jgi:hypothetical protein
MRSVRFQITSVLKGSVVDSIVQYLPYIQKLEISGWPDTGAIRSSDLASITKIPFLKSLSLGGKLFVLKSSQDLKMISRLRYLEELSIAMSPSSVAPFLAWRHKFSTKLRKLSLFIKADKLFFPRALDIATSDIPEWCNSRQSKPIAAAWDDDEVPKKAVYVDPLAGHPLFPSLTKLTISKIGCLSNRFWSLMAHDICPNVHHIELIGDMHGGRTWDKEMPVDNTKEEGKTEEVVQHLVGLFKQVNSFCLRDCWKLHYIKPEKTPHPLPGYIARKHRFLKGLRERNIAVFFRFENWSTYRGFGSFGSFDAEAAIAGEDRPDEENARQNIYL